MTLQTLRWTAAFSAALTLSAVAEFKEKPSMNREGYQVTPLIQIYQHRPTARNSYNRLLVACRVNGHPTHLIVDTGSNVTIIDPHLLKRLGVDFIRKGKLYQGVKGNASFVPLVKITSLQIGSVVSHDETAVTTPSPMMLVLRGPSAGFSEAGLLGAHFLKEHDAVIDCQRGALLLKTEREAKNFLPAALPPHGWVGVPFTLTKDGHILVTVRINGLTGNFGVDTGAPYSVLNRTVAESLKISLGWKRFQATGLQLSDAKARIGKLPQMAIGEYLAQNFTLAVTNAWERVLKQMDTPNSRCLGILGMDFLGNNLAFIDYDSRTIYLKHPGR